MKFLNDVFELLNDNRVLPNYHAERRIDIFINLFLAEILNHSLKKTHIEYILPELPLKKDKNHQSTKVDYLCFDKIEKVIYFIELKTDVKSFKKGQVNIYLNNQTWCKCLDDIKLIGKATKDKKKYQLLQEKLSTSNLFSDDSKSYPIRLIYISPESKKNREILGELDKQRFTTYISFSDLKLFKSTKYPAEWDLFYNKCILNIEN